MTLEELKKIAMCYAHDELKDNCSPIEAVVAGAFMSGIDYIQHNPAWISVEEELPEEGERVLAYNGKINEIHLCDFGLGVFENFIGAFEEGMITHWMHLPQPPKKGGEE